MKKLASTLFFGKDAHLSGLIAFAILGAIALGCACPRNVGNTSTDDNTAVNSSNTSTSNTNSTRAGETKPDASKKTVPPDGQLQYLVRDTMLEFNEAIQKADFTDFHASVCKPWQKQTTPEGMKALFQKFIDGKADFGEISDMTATISTKKTKKEGGVTFLEVAGEYPTSPNPTTFELNYIPEGSDWKLSKIQVFTTVYTRQ